MFCTVCGKELADDLSFCSYCGAKTINNTELLSNQTANNKLDNINKKKSTTVIKIVVAVVVLVFAVAFISNNIAKANLKKALVKEWKKTDGTIILVLDIQDEKIDYRFETGYAWMDITAATFEWKPVSGNKIKIKIAGEYKIYKVKFNRSKDVLYIYPAVTSVGEQEVWYYV